MRATGNVARMQETTVPAVRLDADAWAERMTQLGVGRVEDQAELIGVSTSQLYRVIGGDAAPGERFIAAAIAKTGAKFEQLFTITAAAE